MFSYLRAIRGALWAQFLVSRNPFDGASTIVMGPLYGIVIFAILKNSDRLDLAGFALVAPFLISVTVQGVFQAGELFSRDRDGQTLELVVGAPAPYYLVLASRVTVVMAMSIPAFAVTWLLGWSMFGINATLHHPGVFAITLFATLFAASGTSVATTALFSFGRSSRTFQATIAFWPVMLLGGVTVPVTLLPDWIEPLSRAVFLYWSGNLLRDSFAAGAVDDLLLRLGALFLIGVIGALFGGWLVTRMLDHHKREGTLSL